MDKDFPSKIVGVVILGLLYFLFNFAKSYLDNKAQSIYNSRKRELKLEMEEDRDAINKKIDARIEKLKEKELFILSQINSFKIDYVHGRKWLAEFIAEADVAYDNSISDYLANKDHPAQSAAEIVKEVKAEKRAAMKQIKFLEYQIKSYKEYFPFLEEFEDSILTEEMDFSTEKSNDIIESIDRVSLYITKEDYKKLSTVERNQLALNKYTQKHKKKWEVGRLYERYLGHLYETDGWEVIFVGALKGFEDMGRDLICFKGKETLIVQAKCWALDKTIHEKHVFQLFGSTLSYEMENNVTPGSVKGVFASTTKLSKVALAAADRLGIEVRQIPLNDEYPMIKCNINQDNRIYHLPFDQQYDKIKVGKNGEFYAKTVAEAEALGFRRAKRYYG